MTDERPERTPPRRGLVGRLLGGRYRVTAMVSSGASTLIADADDTELHRQVTVKLVRPEWAEVPEFRQRFQAAMRTISGLSHPNMAAIYDWGEETVGKRTTVYAVTEYLGGGSLRDLFDRGRYLDPSQALLVGLEACRGLDYAHRKGLIHSELTPAKLVFGDDRRLRIVDFGLARLLGLPQWQEPATVATHVARYASPEQALAEPLDGRTDVYSLALILVEAVTREVPFAAGSTVATLAARVGRLMPVSADLGGLAAVLERAGRPIAADRSTAAEFGRALVRPAEKLARPSPIPILVTELPSTDPTSLRRPNDPTGGVRRPRPERGVALVPPSPPPAAPAVPIAGTPPAGAGGDEVRDGADVRAADAPAAHIADAARAPDERRSRWPFGRRRDESSTAAETDVASSPAESAVVPTPPGADQATDPPGVDGARSGADAETEVVAAPAAVPAPSGPDEPTEPGAVEESAPSGAVGPPADPPGAPVGVDPVESGATTRATGTPSRPETDADDTAATAVPAVAAVRGVQAELPPPSVPEHPAVYDGETDATKDELAALVAGGAAPSSSGAITDPPRATVATVAIARPVSTAVATAPVARRPADTPAADAPRADAEWSRRLSSLDDGRRRSRWLPALATFLVLAMLCGLAFVAYLLFRVQTHEVPALAGVDVERAQALVADFDWEVEVERIRSDEEPDLDQIVRTTPAAGADLAEGEPFLIVVSDGPEFRALPELVGLSRGDAETALAELRLDATAAGEAYDEDVAVGDVVSWSVPSDPTLVAGGDVVPDTEVQFVVSRGPEPRVVPDLLDLTTDEARAALDELRLETVLAAAEFDTDVPAGGVLAVDPPAGTTVERGTAIRLTPSKGPDLVVLPEITGQTLAQARQTLADAGLQVGALLGNTAGTVLQMSVGGDVADPGSEHLRYTAIDLALF